MQKILKNGDPTKIPPPHKLRATQTAVSSDMHIGRTHPHPMHMHMHMETQKKTDEGMLLNAPDIGRPWQPRSRTMGTHTLETQASSDMHTCRTPQHTMHMHMHLENQIKNPNKDRPLNAPDMGRSWQPRSRTEGTHILETQPPQTHTHACTPTRTLEIHKQGSDRCYDTRRCASMTQQHVAAEVLTYTCQANVFSQHSETPDYTRGDLCHTYKSIAPENAQTPTRTEQETQAQAKQNVRDTEPSVTQGTQTTQQP